MSNSRTNLHSEGPQQTLLWPSGRFPRNDSTCQTAVHAGTALGRLSIAADLTLPTFLAGDMALGPLAV